MRLKVATYNVRGFRCHDGTRDPARAAAVIRELAADVVGLQEVACASCAGEAEAPCDPAAVLEELAASVGMTVVAGLNLHALRSPCCNALLVRREVLAVHVAQSFDLSRPGKEPREAVTAVLGSDSDTLRAVSLHMGLGPIERASQVGQLVGLCKGWGNHRIVLLGDFNEWSRLGRTGRSLIRDLGAPPRGATFPVGWSVAGIPVPPFLPLDRIGTTPDLRVVDARPHDSRLARTVSDHLPLAGYIETA